VAISIDWGTKVINVPQSYLTPLGGSLYELDVDQFRLDLKDIEDSEDGMSFPDTHRHNTEVVLSGVTYARTLEIINGYTITFENGNYSVKCVGANHNIGDVKNVNSVSLIIGNAAGLISVSSGSGLSTEEHDTLFKLDSYVKNKRYLSKEGIVWYLVLRNDGDTADLRKKALKDKDGNNITDLTAGILAQEMASSV